MSDLHVDSGLIGDNAAPWAIHKALSLIVHDGNT
jgi:hypothetical protein